MEFITTLTQLLLQLGVICACVPHSLKDLVQLHPKGLQHKTNETYHKITIKNILQCGISSRSN